MWETRDIVIFLAGAEVFHTLSHILFNYSGTLPVHFWFINWTKQLNLWGIIINALITLGLFWWIAQLS
jgi:hypothetical protein